MVFSVHAEQAVMAAALKARGFYHLLPLLHPDVPVKPYQQRALARARRMFRGMVMIVQRQTAADDWANAMPCTRCKEMLLRFGVRAVEYTTPQGWVAKSTRDCTSVPTTAHHLCSHVLRE